jgi:hypothetical protein
MRCPNCAKMTVVQAVAPTSATRPAPTQAEPDVRDDQAVEHLRAIRCYMGWLLAIAAAPLVLTGLAVAVWLAGWMSSRS